MQTTNRPHRVSGRQALTVDTMVMRDGGNTGSGTRFGVFSVVDGKIHEFIDFQIG